MTRASEANETRFSFATKKSQRKLAGRIVARHGGLCIGSGPLYDQKKFDTPLHPRFPPGSRRAGRRIRDRRAVEPPAARLRQCDGRRADGLPVARRDGYIMCHPRTRTTRARARISPFALTPSEERDSLAEYDVVKSAIRQTFVDSGATLSHHHAVGPSIPRGWSRTSRRRRRDVTRAVRRGGRVATSTRGSSSDAHGA